jgi:hypothetical protein
MDGLTNIGRRKDGKAQCRNTRCSEFLEVKQDALRVDPTATTPAHHSLHSAGRGVDVGNWTALGPDAQNRVVSAAKMPV